MARLSVDRAFLGADGVVAGVGLCEASAQQAWLKECIVARAADVIVLADTEKLGRARQQHWTPLQRQWKLITSSLANDTMLQPFRDAADIELEVAPCGAIDAASGLPSLAG